MADSLAAAKLVKNFGQRNRLSAFALSDRLEKHSFGFSVCLESLLPFRHQDGYQCAFGKVRIFQFNSTIDDPTGSHSHQHILAPVDMYLTFVRP